MARYIDRFLRYHGQYLTIHTDRIRRQHGQYLLNNRTDRIPCLHGHTDNSQYL